MPFKDENGYREFTAIPGYQRAVVKTTQRTGKTAELIDVSNAKYVVHVTVGRKLYNYPYPPQYSVGWGGGHSLVEGQTYDLATFYTDITGPTKVSLIEGEVLRLQHCGADRSGYTLLGPGDPPRAQCQTNRAGYVVQCEFILNATNDPAYLFDWEYDIIAREIAAQIQGLRDAVGDQTLINPSRIRDWHGSAAWGFNDPWEMSCEQFFEYDGILGHVDAPGQSHWDPGNWNHQLVSNLVTQYLQEGDPTMNVIRVFGQDRYSTAAAVSAFAWQPTDVALATGESFPDALSAAAKASGVLLTRRDALPPATVAELKRLAPSRVVIIGGTTVVSAAVEQAVRVL